MTDLKSCCVSASYSRSRMIRSSNCTNAVQCVYRDQQRLHVTTKFVKFQPVAQELVFTRLIIHEVSLKAFVRYVANLCAGSVP